MIFKKYLFNSVRKKILFGFLAAIIGPLVAVVFFVVQNVGSTALDLETEMTRIDARVHSERVSFMLEGFRNDVIFLSQLPPISGIQRARDNNGVDPIQNSTLEQWLERLAATFESLAETKLSYMQIRYIDENGQELVRVDSDDSTVSVIPEDGLQYKGDRYYFKNAMNLLAGNLFISDLDLNKEGSPPEIEVPYKPVIRYAVPIFDEQGSRRGVIVTNVHAGQFLDAFHDEHSDETRSEEDFLLSSEGYYYIHPEKGKEWGGPQDLDTGYNMIDDFPPALLDVLFSGQSGVYLTDEHVYAYAPVFFDMSNNDEFWVFTERISKKLALSRVIYLRNMILVASLIFVIIVSFIIRFIAVSISRPIKSLQEGAKSIAQGDFNLKVGTKDLDEIGQLSRDFDKMATAIKKSRAEIDQKVKSQTEDIKKQKESLEKQKESLERSNAIMVNRELKMVELKKKVKNLEDKK